MGKADKGASILDEEIARGPTMRGATEYLSEVESLWLAGLPPGDKTGWPSVDKHYTVCPGQMSIITGWPGAGKSEWLDALMVNLARQSWKFAVFSAENMPVQVHISKLMEKMAGMPFGNGPTPRIPQDSIAEYCDELSTAFRFISPRNDCLSLKRVVETAQSWLLENDGRKAGLVIDPWNELEHWRDRQFSETEYISQSLSFVRNWARANNVHVWIVAHPQKVPRDNGKLPVPRPDMISGSMHWWNKADCAIAVWRDPEQPEARSVDVIVQKVRFKHIGRPGVITLNYDRATGRYSEQMAPRAYRQAKDGD